MFDHMHSRLAGGLLALVLVMAGVAPAADAKHTGPVIREPAAGGTYLALGDSLAFGYQQAKVLACAATGCTSPDTQFATGYVNDYAATLDVPDLNLVNLGCPGESSATLLSATNSTSGCAGVFAYPFPIHVNHPGETQLEAALDVLRSEGKHGLLITLDIGPNDVLALIRGTCTSGDVIDLTCVQSNTPATFAAIEANLDSTLAALRQRGKTHGKKHEIIVVGVFNALYPAVFQQVLSQTGSAAAAAAAGAATDAVAAQLNSLQAATAAKYSAVFVDPLPVFNPQGNPTVELATICTLTAVCGPLHDVHPTDGGYAAIANLIAAADGF